MEINIFRPVIIIIASLIVLINTSCSTGESEISSAEEATILPKTSSINPTMTSVPLSGSDSMYHMTVVMDYKSKVYDIAVGCLPDDACVISRSLMFEREKPVTDPSWSPDGNELVFVEELTLYITNDFGENIAQLVKIPHKFAQNPNWTLDGKKVAFSISSQMGESAILLFPFEGGSLETILENTIHPIQVAWANNGMAAYTAYDNLDEARYKTDIINADGSLYWSIPFEEDKQDFYTRDAKFSPDSEWVLYTGSWLNNDRIYLANLKEKTSIELLPIEQTCSQFNHSWSPDGKWVAFTSNCYSENYFSDELFITNITGEKKYKLDLGLEGSVWDFSWYPITK